jgi:hypothetical protein
MSREFDSEAERKINTLFNYCGNGKEEVMTFGSNMMYQLLWAFTSKKM